MYPGKRAIFNADALSGGDILPRSDGPARSQDGLQGLDFHIGNGHRGPPDTDNLDDARSLQYRGALQGIEPAKQITRE